MAKSYFPKAKPSTGKRRPRKPQSLRTHVFINSGMTDYKGEPICAEPWCGHLREHRIHDLTQATEISTATAEIDQRRGGE